MSDKEKLVWSLFLLRLGVFIVMVAWTLDKILAPAHAARIFQNFYFITGLETAVMRLIGVVELLIVLAFAAGLWKRFTYGFVIILHGISTLSSWRQYSVAINLLFFAAWPMLAACIALYLLRDKDVKFTMRQREVDRPAPEP